MDDQSSILSRDTEGIFLRHRVQTGSGADPVSYAIGTGRSSHRWGK